jgi:hypothetical protein
MAALSTVALLALAGAKTALDYKGQRDAAKQQEQKGDFEAGLFRQNATLADAQAEDAVTRGKPVGAPGRTWRPHVERRAARLARRAGDPHRRRLGDRRRGQRSRAQHAGRAHPPQQRAAGSVGLSAAGVELSHAGGLRPGGGPQRRARAPAPGGRHAARRRRGARGHLVGGAQGCRQRADRIRRLCAGAAGPVIGPGGVQRTAKGRGTRSVF